MSLSKELMENASKFSQRATELVDLIIKEN